MAETKTLAAESKRVAKSAIQKTSRRPAETRARRRGAEQRLPESRRRQYDKNGK